MKKIIILISLLTSVSLISVHHTFAATTTSSTWTKTISIPLDASKVNEASAELKNIDVNFCEQWSNKQMNYTVEPWKKLNICLQITNNSNSWATVNLGFIDGTFTNDQRKNRACELSKIDKFGKYMTGYDTLISLAPHAAIRKESSFTSPANQTGMVYGCVVYSIINNDPTTQWFGIQIRKAKFINISLTYRNIFTHMAADVVYRSSRIDIACYSIIVLGVCFGIGLMFKKRGKKK